MESRTPNPYAIIDDEPSFDPYSETNTTVESANVEQPTKVVTIPVSPVYQTVVIEPNEVVYTDLCACDGVWWIYCCLSFWCASIAGCVTNRRLKGSNCLTSCFVIFFCFSLIGRDLETLTGGYYSGVSVVSRFGI